LVYHRNYAYVAVAVFHTALSDAPVRGSPLLGGPHWNTAVRLVWKKLNGVANRWWERFDDMFSHFDRLLACNRQTDGQRDIFRGA